MHSGSTLEEVFLLRVALRCNIGCELQTPARSLFVKTISLASLTAIAAAAGSTLRATVSTLNPTLYRIVWEYKAWSMLWFPSQFPCCYLER